MSRRRKVHAMKYWMCRGAHVRCLSCFGASACEKGSLSRVARTRGLVQNISKLKIKSTPTVGPSSRQQSMKAFASILLLIIFFDCVVHGALSSMSPHEQPLIGILSLPLSPERDNENASLVEKSFARWLQGAGAKVIAIPFNETEHVLRKYADDLAGILFTGGAGRPTDMKRYLEAATVL